MVIYLKHAVHGRKVAVSEAEAVYDEKNGWERYEVGALMQPAPAVAPVNAMISASPASDDIVALREKYTAKFGQKPHHKKSADTLRRELEAA